MGKRERQRYIMSFYRRAFLHSTKRLYGLDSRHCFVVTAEMKTVILVYAYSQVLNSSNFLMNCFVPKNWLQNRSKSS